MQWLNENGMAIQTIVTTALVIVTGVYVFLTLTIAKSSAAAVKFQNRAIRARFYQTDIMLERIMQTVGSIPRNNQLEKWTRTVVFWTDEELDGMGELLGEFVSTSKQGAALLNGLRWIKETTERNKQVPELRGIDWGKFDFPQFYYQVEEVEKAVAQTKKDLNKLLK